MSSLIAWAADHLLKRREQRIEVHLRIHRANLHVLNGQPIRPTDCYFLNLWNASPERPVQVTHLWIETPGGHLSVLTRPLPVTIAQQHQWETWIEVGQIPASTDVERDARAKLADGRVIESEPRNPSDSPPAGAVPG
jgi:hypothetical protein